MFFAYSVNHKRIYIDDTNTQDVYYCPYCQSPLIIKKGKIRQHHFAHRSNCICTDMWERRGVYDNTEWHNEWQSQFSKENQEIKLSLGDITHRADVLVNQNVVQFQNVKLSSDLFSEKNNYFLSLGYKVIWLFNLTDLVNNGKAYYSNIDRDMLFTWSGKNNNFDKYDMKDDNVEIFFQINDKIVKVIEPWDLRNNQIKTSCFFGKKDFIDYIENGRGLGIEINNDDIQFKKYVNTYYMKLSKEQEKAVRLLDGATLLLAVPGSGKTSVLIARLGHMIINKNVLPEEILVLAYNKNAVNEIKERVHKKFGERIEKQINIKTINAFCNDIYSTYCRKRNYKKKIIIEENEKKNILKNICDYKDVSDLSTIISYIKNMMIDESDKLFIENKNIYKSYVKNMEDENKMDFDDQMVFANEIITKDQEILNIFRQK